MDGYEKLEKYGIQFYGMIDGYSRVWTKKVPSVMGFDEEEFKAIE